MSAEIETETETETHWGVRLPGGVIRWNPGYGTGVYIPYTEIQARDDAARNGGVVLTRRETTTVETTEWVVAPEPETALAPTDGETRPEAV